MTAFACTALAAWTVLWFGRRYFAGLTAIGMLKASHALRFGAFRIIEHFERKARDRP